MAKPTASTPKAKRLQKIWVAETKKDALAIADHRGEILKFIGDGLLAIFPLAAFEGIADAAMNAMAAAHEALAAVHAIEHESPLDLPLVVSDDFSRAHGGALRSLGLHKLRGLIGKIRI